MAELIASGDTLNTGRIAINNWFSGSTNIWTANTNNTVWQLTGGTNAGSSVMGFAFGKIHTLSSGSYNFIGNGSANTSSNSFSFIGNGRSNVSSGAYSIIGNGTGNTVNASLSFVGNGKNNTGQATMGFIGNGNTNKVTNAHTVIINGNANRCYSNYSFIGNGKTNTLANSTSNYSVLLNGISNLMLSNSDHSFMMGYSNTISSSNYAFSFGKTNSISSAPYAVAFGRSHSISGDYSIAWGNGASSSTNKEMVFSNGGGGNTVKIDFNAGEFYCDSGIYSDPADYAEYFEWADGNPDGDKRFGYSVCLAENGMVKIGNENIIGIVSSNPVVIGDAAELSWSKKHKTDEWGIKQTEIFHRFSLVRNEQKIRIWIDKDGKQYSQIPRNSKEKIDYFIQDFYEITQEEHNNKKEELVYLHSEEYDATKEYIPRSERKEFSTIGLLGKLRVRTAEQITAKFIDFNNQGMAVNGTKYTVLEHIKNFDGQYGIVKIFFK